MRYHTSDHLFYLLLLAPGCANMEQISRSLLLRLVQVQFSCLGGRCSTRASYCRGGTLSPTLKETPSTFQKICPELEVIPTKLARYLNAKFILNGALAEWSHFCYKSTNKNSSLDSSSLFFVVLVPFFRLPNPLFRACIEVAWEAYVGPRVSSKASESKEVSHYLSTSQRWLTPQRLCLSLAIESFNVKVAQRETWNSTSSGWLLTSWMSASESLECARRSMVSTWGTQKSSFYVLDAVLSARNEIFLGWEIEFFQI